MCQVATCVSCGDHSMHALAPNPPTQALMAKCFATATAGRLENAGQMVNGTKLTQCAVCVCTPIHTLAFSRSFSSLMAAISRCSRCSSVSIALMRVCCLHPDDQPGGGRQMCSALLGCIQCLCCC